MMQLSNIRYSLFTEFEHVIQNDEEQITRNYEQGLREGGSGGTLYPGPRGARKSSGFCVKFWYRNITP